MIRYDYSQPYITRDEYLEVKGIDLNIELQDDDNQSNKVNRFIQDITNFVLDHLVMEYNCNELNRQTNQFEDLAEFRRVRFHYGMMEEIEYVLNNGLIQLDSGINRETGAIMDLSGLVIGSSALKQFRLGGFCNKQEGTGHRGDLSPKDMPTVEELVLELGKKVDKVDGKGLSTNDYTTADKLLLKSVAQDLNSKVDQENGKVLSDNNFSDAYKAKVDGIESGAQQNVIEEIKLENEPITVAGKSVNIDVSYKEDKSNKSTIISSSSTDIQYPSAKAVHNAVESAKASAESYADSKVTRANLVQVLGEASQYLNGLMSAQDKERLDVLYALLGDSEDADTVVDTINEVLAIFNQYPEGADLVNALASKVEYDDIINTVDSNETRKPLSAAMGKYLKGLIDALTLVVNAKANSNDVYTKTEIDEMVEGFVFAEIDTELDPESENAVQNKVVAEELEKKANKDGNYPTMTVGQAEAIASNREIDNPEIACPPITYGIAGGEAEIQTGINKLEYLEGKSIVVNETILSSKSASLISRGKNQFSALNEFTRVIAGEEYELSGITAGSLIEYDASQNEIETHSITDRTVLTMSEETHYIKIAATTHEDIMFYLTFPEDGGVYNEPYIAPRVETVVLPNIELRSVGDVKDIAYANGGGKRRVGIVDLGTLNWSSLGNGMFTSSGIETLTFYQAKLLCSKYNSESFNDVIYPRVRTGVAIATNKNIWIYDSSKTSATSAEFKNSLSGVYLLYELATETDIPLSENPGWSEDLFVDNFGTLEFTTDPAQVPQVEQPYFIRYTVSLVEFIDTAYVKCEGDGNNIATEKEAEAFRKGTDAVGLARASETLTPFSEESGATDTNAFVFQTAGGDADINDTAYLRALRGNTVVLNQLYTAAYVADSTRDGITFTRSDEGKTWTVNGTATGNAYALICYDVPMKKNHKYLLKGNTGNGSESTYYLCMNRGSYDFYDYGNGVVFNNPNNDGTMSIALRVLNGTTVNNVKFHPQLFDLTQMFGVGNEPTSVEEFNRLFPKPYYEYSAGELLSSKVNGIKNVGYNAFDKNTVKTSAGNYILNDNGEQVYDGNSSYFEEYIRVLPNTVYHSNGGTTVNGLQRIYFYTFDKQWISRTATQQTEFNFTTPANCHFIRIQYCREYFNADNVCLNLYWDGSRTGYEPYKSETYPLPNVELRSAGDVYDELKPDGTLIRRVGVITAEELASSSYSWRMDSYNRIQMVSGYSLPNAKGSDNTIANAMTNVYSISRADFQPTGKSLSINSAGRIIFTDSSYTGGDNSDNIKTFILSKGLKIFYELAEPTEEQTQSTFQELMPIDDFGTQEFLYDDDVFPVPQGNEFFYPVDYKAFIDSLGGREDVQYDAGELVSHTELQAALASFLSSISGYDATKKQTLKNNQGTFVWEDDE